MGSGEGGQGQLESLGRTESSWGGTTYNWGIDRQEGQVRVEQES